MENDIDISEAKTSVFIVNDGKVYAVSMIKEDYEDINKKVLESVVDVVDLNKTYNDLMGFMEGGMSK